MIPKTKGVVLNPSCVVCLPDAPKPRCGKLIFYELTSCDIKDLLLPVGCSDRNSTCKLKHLNWGKRVQIPNLFTITKTARLAYSRSIIDTYSYGSICFDFDATDCIWSYLILRSLDNKNNKHLGWRSRSKI